MVDRVIVTPESIRGLGNIVIEKGTSDYSVFQSELSSGTDTINGEDSTVFCLSYQGGYVVLLTVSSSSVSYGSSVTLTATVTEAGSGVSGETVTFYDGETSLGTGTTNSSGVATLSTSSLSIGSHSLSAVSDDVVSNSATVTVSKLSTTISLSGSDITYGSNVSLSGTASIGSGASVKIYQGTTLLDTVTTGTGGAFNTSVTGLNAGSYTFKAIYEGDSTHDGCEATKTVTVSKATPTISLTASSSTVTVGGSVSVSGTLSLGSGMSVKIYDGTTLLDTITTGTDGAFSKSLSTTVAHTYSVKAVYEGSANYNSVTSSTVSVEVVDTPTPTPASISLTADKSILSYVDSQSATLSATVLDSSSQGVSGETVEFFKGSTSLGTATTDSNGVATKSYTSTGAGDVSFTASVGSLVSEIYAIQDCLLYDAAGFSKTTTTSTDTSYNSNYDYGLASINNFQMEFDFNNPSGCRLYFAHVKVQNTGDNVQYGIGFTRDGSGNLTFTERTTSTSNTTCQSIPSGTNHYKVVFNGNVVSVWVNDVQHVSNKTISWWSSYFPYYFSWAIWNTVTGTVTNLKIKSL